MRNLLISIVLILALMKISACGGGQIDPDPGGGQGGGGEDPPERPEISLKVFRGGTNSWAFTGVPILETDKEIPDGETWIVKNPNDEIVQTHAHALSFNPDETIRVLRTVFKAETDGKYTLTTAPVSDVVELVSLGVPTPKAISVTLNGTTISSNDMPVTSITNALTYDEIAYKLNGELELRLVNRVFIDGSQRSYLTITNTVPSTTSPQPKFYLFGEASERKADMTVSSNFPFRIRSANHMGYEHNEVTSQRLIGIGTIDIQPGEIENGDRLRSGERKTWELSFDQANKPVVFCKPERYKESGLFYPITQFVFNTQDLLREQWHDQVFVGVTTIWNNNLGPMRKPHLNDWRWHGEIQRDWDGGDLNKCRQSHQDQYDFFEAFMKRALMSGYHENPELLPGGFALKAWDLCAEGFDHFINIDILHIERDTGNPLDWANYGPFAHTDHGECGVDEPHRGNGPMGIYMGGKGAYNFYLLTGEPYVLEPLEKMWEQLKWKVDNGPGMPGISGTRGEERAPANVIAHLTNAFNHYMPGAMKDGYLESLWKAIQESTDFRPYNFLDLVNGTWGRTNDCGKGAKPWMISLLVKNLDKTIKVLEYWGETTIAEEARNRKLLWQKFLTEVAVEQECPCGQGCTSLYEQMWKPAGSCFGGRGYQAGVSMWDMLGADVLADKDLTLARELARTGIRFPWYCNGAPPVGEYTKLLNHGILIANGDKVFDTN
jgi:hypothetical protein